MLLRQEIFCNALTRRLVPFIHLREAGVVQQASQLNHFYLRIRQTHFVRHRNSGIAHGKRMRKIVVFQLFVKLGTQQILYKFFGRRYGRIFKIVAVKGL